jgi:hypothetical protein
MFTENYRPNFSLERAPHMIKSVIIKERMKKKFVTGTRWMPDTKTDWLADPRS